jgi:hypothetical protein
MASRVAPCDVGAFEAGPTLPLVDFVEPASSVFEGSGSHQVEVKIDNTSGTVAGGTPLTLFLAIMG